MKSSSSYSDRSNHYKCICTLLRPAAGVKEVNERNEHNSCNNTIIIHKINDGIPEMTKIIIINVNEKEV